MKKFIKEKVTKIEPVLVAVSCNCCGKKIRGDTCGSDITEVNVGFGYGSRFDMEKWTMDICDDCIEQWVSTFKHTIEKKNMVF